MKRMRIIGILSSVLIILNYLEVGLIPLIFSDSELMTIMNETLFRIIFAASTIAFYYIMARYLYSEFKINVKVVLNILIAIQVLSSILKVLEYFSIIIHGFVFTLLYISAIIVFIIFGIKVLKLDSKINHLIKNLKTFVVLMFISFGLVFISSALFPFVLIRMMNPETTPIIYFNSFFLIYVIPYVFGLIFFLKMKNNQQLIKQTAPPVIN